MPTSQNHSFENWAEYLELSKNNPPSALLESAIPLVSNRDLALDLGAGALRDTKFLLSSGFKKVLAIDSEKDIRKYRSKIPASSLQIKVTQFEKLKLPKNTFDLINAQFSLSFTEKSQFPKLINQIKNSLQDNGIFCANFFGNKDSWNSNKNFLHQNMTFLTEKALLESLDDLEILYFNEKFFKGKTIDNLEKNWHIFEVIALKNPHQRKSKTHTKRTKI